MPKVSVITPTYNRGWIIERAIKSVLGQSYQDFELIVVDDGSSDNTNEILSSVKDTRVKVIKTKHLGVSAARNKGLSQSKGELIAYLDSDNIWHPNFLKVMVSETKSPFVLTYCDENLLLLSGRNPETDIIGRKIRNVEYNPVKLAKTNYIDINSVMHPKELLEEIGKFDEELTAYEDWDFFIRIALKFPFRVKHVEQVLCDYYYFLTGSTSTVTNKTLSDNDILAYFQMKEPDQNGKKVIKKIKKILEGE